MIIGVAGALWSASGYVGAFGRAMNRIYEIEEGRPFWKLRPLMIVITLAAVILAGLVAIGLVVSGPVARAIGDAIGLGETAVTVWGIVEMAGAARAWPRWWWRSCTTPPPTCSSPNSSGSASARWSPSSPGSIASALFGLYVSQFSNYNKTYGSLAGVIIFLLWLWITNLALLFGAELNAEMERGRQLQAGIPAEDELQLPRPRHPGHREERGQGRSGYRAGPATQKQPWGHFRTGRVLTEN